jgi:uncharacterized protein YciI
MALFTIICRDRDRATEARAAARADHLAFVDTFGPQVKVAGPFLDDAGGMIGSLLIMEFEDRAAAQAFVDGDPYGKAGVFKSVEVLPWRVTRGSLG